MGRSPLDFSRLRKLADPPHRATGRTSGALLRTITALFLPALSVPALLTCPLGKFPLRLDRFLSYTSFIPTLPLTIVPTTWIARSFDGSDAVK